jgi:glycosyltransferase involved in cell wall biosynthesis
LASSIPLIYCFEPEQGAAFARQQAVREAKGELIGFLDDDNLPESDWIVQAYLFGKQYPKAGAYGGKIHAKYEVFPPENFAKIEGFLAIRERGEHPNLYRPEVLSLPPGAAMVVRRQAWLDCVSSRPKLGGKAASSMVQGDDWEPLIYLYKAGWEIWYNPQMHTEHQIPASRLERDYLLKLIHGSCLCFIPLKMMLVKPWQKPIILAKTVLGNSYKAALHYFKFRSQLKTDRVAKCELQIYLSRISSVWYFIKTELTQR